MASSSKGLGAEFENPPPGEPALIDSVAQLTSRLLDRRYAGKPRVLRGVHPKDHGCVEATFIVAKDIAPEYRVGLFRNPGEEFRAAIRFSNCAPLVLPDSLEPGPGGALVRAHGSRGMAIKLYGVTGNRLQPKDGERTQDLLMINQPVFAFANVEDYKELNEVIFKDLENPNRFFQERTASPNIAVKMRALKSLAIVREVKSLSTTPPPPMNPPFPTLPYPYQAPPLSPLDNRYFSAAPFAFGPGRVMKYAVNPTAPVAGDIGAAIDDPDYLRKAMRARMAQGGTIIWFDFQVQVRGAATLAGQPKIDNEMENMCTLWDEKTYPFVTVARIAIPTQDVSQPDRQEFCETLFFTPWHGLEDHRPLGGINRMRQKVYETSSVKRGCPVSPELPAKLGRGGGRPPPGGARRF